MGSRTTAAAVGGLLLLVVVAPATATPLHGVPTPDDGPATSSGQRAGLASTSCEWPLLDFARYRYVEQRGDVVRIPLLFQAGFEEGIHFHVVGPDGRYVLTADLADGNDDRRLTLLFDTGANVSGQRLRTAAPADELTDLNETVRDSPLPLGAYDVGVEGNSCAEGDATLRLERPRPLVVDAYRGNRSLLGDRPSPAAIESGLDLGVVRRSYDHDLPTDGAETFVLRGEALVLAVESPALVERVDAAGDGDLRTAVREALSVTVTESWSSVDRSEPVDRNDLSSFDGWLAVADPSDDIVYLLLDTRAPFTPDDVHRDYGTVGDRYVVTVETAGGANGTTAFEFATPEAAIEETDSADSVILPSRDGATVRGTADLPNGTTLSVELQSSAGEPFPLTATATVDDGRFAATFDLAGAENGTTVETVARHGRAVVASESGRIRGAANVQFGENVLHVRTGDLQRVRLERVSTTAGGFVVVHDGYFGGPVVGVSEYLPPGDHTDVAVSLNGSWDGPLTLAAVVHRDGDGDRQLDSDADPVYWGGSPKDAVRFVDERVETTGTATTERVTPASLTATPPHSDTVPGPGAALAAVALALATLVALLAHRSGGVRR